ncbi:MAG: hypothetical protein OK455_01255 [Thaumarchaeota archaeon]|nr:hypothetical protein [Nitrososphaerota archaeon]
MALVALWSFSRPVGVRYQEVLKIHLAVVDRAILAAAHLLEECADAAPLRPLLLALLGKVVRHGLCPPRGERSMPPPITRPETYDAKTLAPAPVRRNKQDAPPRSSSAVWKRSACEHADKIKAVANPNPGSHAFIAAALGRDISC